MTVSTALVLGGTNPHIALVNHLKNRGYTVVLVDYLADPPAARFADVHVRESTLDIDAVTRAAVSHQASLVISAAIDQANVTACIVADRLGLPKPYSVQTARALSAGARPCSTPIHL